MINRLGGLSRRLGGLATHPSVIARGFPTTGAINLPSWVPSPGSAATFTRGGGVLTNNWRDVFDPTAIGFDIFHARKVTDYSATFLHANWRSFGGRIIWGCGHSASNYNGLTIKSYYQDTIAFEALQAGTPWTGGVLDTGNNASQCDATYGEVTGSSPLKLASPHSYGVGDVIDDYFVQVSASALGYSNWGGTQAVHRIDLSNPSTSASTRAWERVTNTVGSYSPFTAPTFTRYVPSQNRIFLANRGGGGPYPIRWFNRADNTFVTGSGVGFNYGDGSVDAGAAPIHVPSRDLLIGAYRSSGGVVVLEYMDVGAGVSQPTLGGTATLSSALTVPAGWGAIGWCPDNNLLHVFGVTGNTDKVYEIAIPSTLSSTWTVTAHTLPSGSITPYTGSTNSALGKTWDYNLKTRCFDHLPNGISEAGDDVVQAYRPRFT